MYRASAGAFAFQHDVRVAQHARDDVMKAYLATEADVRGFAATNDRYFAEHYRERAAAFDPVSASLQRIVTSIGIRGGRQLVERENQTFHAWVRGVAGAIVERPGAASRQLLRTADPAYVGAMFDADRRLGNLLDDVATQSEIDRQRFLRNVLLASVLLVLVAATIVTLFLWARALAQRRLLVQGALYAEEQRVTAMLQLALTPDRLPVIAGLPMTAIYVPAGSENAVGGDWYEVYELLDGHVLLIIGDVAGHGLAAAVTMNKARQALLAAAVVETEPAAILARANLTLYAQAAGMVTAACCIFDPRSRHLEYATAGHPPPIVATATGASAILTSGAMPLGIMPELDIVSYATILECGTMLMLYTDGLLEERHDVIAGEQLLLAVTERFRSADDPATAIYNAVIPDGRPRDDVAILTLSIRPAAR